MNEWIKVMRQIECKRAIIVFKTTEAEIHLFLISIPDYQFPKLE